MKNLLALILMTLVAISLSAQGLKTEKCNWKYVELKPYSAGLENNEVVVGSATFLYDIKIESFEDMTEKQLKKIKKYAPMFRSCKIYVDFEQTMLDKKLNPQLTDKHLHIVAVLKKKV